MRSMQQQLGVLGNISTFAYRQTQGDQENCAEVAHFLPFILIYVEVSKIFCVFLTSVKDITEKQSENKSSFVFNKDILNNGEYFRRVKFIQACLK